LFTAVATDSSKLFSVLAEICYLVSDVLVEVCLVATNYVGKLSGRAETVKRDLYRLLESVAYKSPIAWIIRGDICREKVLPKIEKLNNEFRELTGKDLVVVMRATISENELKQLLGYSEPPKSRRAVIVTA
jgi:hypothetical protein